MTKFSRILLMALVVLTVGAIVFMVVNTSGDNTLKVPEPRYLAKSNIVGETTDLTLIEKDEFRYYTPVVPNEEDTIRVDDNGHIKVMYLKTSVETYQYGVLEAVNTAVAGLYEDSILKNSSTEIEFRNSTCVETVLQVSDAFYANTTNYLVCPVETGVISVEYSRNTLEAYSLDEAFQNIINSIH